MRYGKTADQLDGISPPVVTALDRDNTGRAPLSGLDPHTQYFYQVVTANGSSIATAGDDKTVRLWNAADGAAVRSLTGPAENVWSVVFSSDDSQLAGGGADGTIHLWNVADAAEQGTLHGHAGVHPCGR